MLNHQTYQRRKVEGCNTRLVHCLAQNMNIRYRKLNPVKSPEHARSRPASTLRGQTRCCPPTDRLLTPKRWGLPHFLCPCEVRIRHQIRYEILTASGPNEADRDLIANTISQLLLWLPSRIRPSAVRRRASRSCTSLLFQFHLACFVPYRLVRLKVFLTVINTSTICLRLFARHI